MAHLSTEENLTLNQTFLLERAAQVTLNKKYCLFDTCVGLLLTLDFPLKERGVMASLQPASDETVVQLGTSMSFNKAYWSYEYAGECSLTYHLRNRFVLETLVKYGAPNKILVEG